MEFFTKRLLAVWALLGLYGLLRDISGWDAVFRVTVVALVTAALLAWIDRRSIAITLSFAYLTPAVILLVSEQYHLYFAVPWLAALLGVFAVDAWRSPWRIARPWRVWLVLWGLATMIGATVLVLREFDFYAPLYFGGIVAPALLPVHPTFAGMWTVHVSIVTIVGILWFDWLHGLEPRDFTRWVLWPLAASALVMAAVTVYQMFGRVTFLNATVFGAGGRASGTMLDANVCGTIAAMWIGGMAVIARPRQRLMLLAVLVLWVAIWGTGSKTAFAAAAVSAGGILWSSTARGVSWRRVWPYAAAAVALVATLMLLRPTVVGPIARMRQVLPRELSLSAMGDFARAMWDRNNYGTASTAMIRAYPWAGVGPGGFNTLSGDYAEYRKGGDNAQNWYRQQLAELGVLGSVGWIAWLGGFLWALWPRRDDAPGRWAIRGALVGFGAISFVGVPSQDPAVTLTFWTFAFWYQAMSGRASGDSSGPSSTPLATTPIKTREWAAIAAILSAFTLVSTRDALGALRPATRAARSGLAYSYGIYLPEVDDVGAEWHWTEGRGTTLLKGEHAWLELRMRVNHPDVDRSPVAIGAWCNGVRVIDARVSNGAPVVVYVSQPLNRPAIVLDTTVSRVVGPAAAGLGDPRILGGQVSWRFVDAPPPSAAIVRLR